jgi:hypothetical protein
MELIAVQHGRGMAMFYSCSQLVCDTKGQTGLFSETAWKAAAGTNPKIANT